jgi:hypothetical protein
LVIVGAKALKTDTTTARSIDDGCIATGSNTYAPQDDTHNMHSGACERSETSKSISTEMPSSSAAASAFEGFAELGSPSTAE